MLIFRSMSFIVPGFIMGIFGFIVFLFVVDSPELIDQHYDKSCNSADVLSHRVIDDHETDDLQNVRNYFFFLGTTRTFNSEHHVLSRYGRKKKVTLKE